MFVLPYCGSSMRPEADRAWGAGLIGRDHAVPPAGIEDHAKPVPRRNCGAKMPGVTMS
jgi:hypothetical protein